MAMRKTNKEVIVTAKKLFLEAAKFFNCEPYQVTMGKFLAVANGRLGRDSINRMGVSFGTLREYLFPSPNNKLTNQSMTMIKRILKNVEEEK